MDPKPTYLNDELYEYMVHHSVRKNNAIESVNDLTNGNFKTKMQSSAELLNYLTWFVELTQAKKILDVGVFTGLSSLAMVQGLTPGGKIFAVDKNERFAKMAQENWQTTGVAHAIELHVGQALPYMQDLLTTHANSFDLIYIDADKPNYDNYYELALQLVRVGGVVMLENTLWYGKVIDAADQKNSTQLIRALNKKLYADPRIKLSMLPISDGLTLCLKQKIVQSR
jgi:caffeoyl-CoA O-methyltransferase